MFLGALNDENKLKARYLLWLYKTIKEELERIDRKFTQLVIDEFMLKEIRTHLKSTSAANRKAFNKHLNELLNYIKNKRETAAQLKFNQAGSLKTEYKFLTLKLSAIESAVKKFLGKKALREMELLYQQEMVQRILEERQHK